ncbi:MAG: outer membrane beta-barrel protein [Aquabacterium sp.]|nr:outer membrane beta-barrel protein [Aquabacterium sp.]
MFKKTMLAVIMATAGSGAMAQLYVGGGLGYAVVSDYCKGASGSCDDNSMGLKLYGGFQLNPSAAVEVAYLDFGQAKYDVSWMHSNLEASAVTVNLAVRAPLSRELGAVGRVGLARVTVDEHFNWRSDRSKSTSQLYLGLGLEYALQKNLKATFSYDLTRGEDAGGGGGNLHLFSAGLQYAF